MHWNLIGQRLAPWCWVWVVWGDWIMLILCITYHHILSHTRRHRSLYSVLQTPDVRGPTQARSAAGPAQRESAQLNPGKPSSEREITQNWVRREHRAMEDPSYLPPPESPDTSPAQDRDRERWDLSTCVQQTLSHQLWCVDCLFTSSYCVTSWQGNNSTQLTLTQLLLLVEDG